MKNTTVATYDMMHLAHIALGRLKAEGVECWLADEHLVATVGVYSPAIGGIKLQVEEKNEQRALEILATDYSAELSAWDDDGLL